MQRERNGVNVITPPGFEPYTGREAYGKGFVLDGSALVAWATGEEHLPAITEAWSALDLDLKGFRGDSIFQIRGDVFEFYAVQRESLVPERLVELLEAERVVSSAFPQLKLKPEDDWTLS